MECFRSYMKYYVIQLYIYWLWQWTLHYDNSNTMMPVFVYWISIYAFLFRSTLNRKLNSELACLAPVCPQVNKLYCPRSRTRFHNYGLCKMLQIKCREYQPNDLSCVLHPWDSPVPMVCAVCTDFQASQLPKLTRDQYGMQVARHAKMVMSD